MALVAASICYAACPLAQATPEVRIDLSIVLSYVRSLQRPSGFYVDNPDGQRWGDWTTLLALESLEAIAGPSFLDLANSSDVLDSLAWSWGWEIEGQWVPSAWPSSHSILVCSQMSMAVPTGRKESFVKLAKASQNPDGGIGRYQGGESTMEAAYWAVRGLSAVNSLNEIDTQRLFAWIQLSSVQTTLAVRQTRTMPCPRLI